jgi:hypothetical protein
MSTTWKSSNQKSVSRESANQATNNTISGTTLSSSSSSSSWSRQQKLAMVVSLAILVALLAVSACSKQSPKPVLVGVSSPAASATSAGAAMLTASPVPATVAESPTAVKKTARKRPANVTYRDANYGVSFLYPRKAVLTSGDKTQPDFAAVGNVPMNFAEPGGVAVATVTLPDSSYPGTDFASAFFNVNVNRGISEQECSHFAFVDTRNADGEPVDAEKVKIGSSDMLTTSTFSASAIKQVETQYYHRYENGACYEYVLGLGTEGFATEGGVRHVDRDAVFAKLEKILATVKINPVEQESAAEPSATTMTEGK